MADTSLLFAAVMAAVQRASSHDAAVALSCISSPEGRVKVTTSLLRSIVRAHCAMPNLDAYNRDKLIKYIRADSVTPNPALSLTTIAEVVTTTVPASRPMTAAALAAVRTLVRTGRLLSHDGAPADSAGIVRCLEDGLFWLQCEPLPISSSDNVNEAANGVADDELRVYPSPHTCFLQNFWGPLDICQTQYVLVPFF
jgi:hypothetical protein